MPSPSKVLTPRELEVLEHLAHAWNLYLLMLPSHPDEQADMRRAIHAAQGIIGMRVARRVDPAVWGQEEEGEEDLDSGGEVV